MAKAAASKQKLGADGRQKQKVTRKVKKQPVSCVSRRLNSAQINKTKTGSNTNEEK